MAGRDWSNGMMMQMAGSDWDNGLITRLAGRDRGTQLTMTGRLTSHS